MELSDHIDNEGQPMNVTIKTDYVAEEYRNDLDFLDWIDYRIGCDICCVGEVFGFKTNMKNLYLQQNIDLLELKIVTFKDCFYSKKQIETYYICKNRDHFPTLLKFNKYMKESLPTSFNYDSDDEDFTIFRSGVTSVFDEEDHPSQVCLCHNCYKWLKYIYPELEDLPMESPLFLFWRDVISGLIDYLQFEKLEDKKDLIEIFNLTNNHRRKRLFGYC